MDRLRLAAWLGRLDVAALAALLDRRPDAVLGRPPATLDRLADRLLHPASLATAVGGLTAPALQALQALRALGERCSRSALLDLLDGGPGPEHERAVDAALAELTAAALVWPSDGGGLDLPVGLGEVLPPALGLGPALRELWSEQYADDIVRALRVLGGRAVGRKAELLDALLARLADPAVVMARVAQAPATVAGGLRRLAWAGAPDEDADLGFDPRLYRQQLDTERWGTDHGLLVGNSWGYRGQMPAEVALALRGANFRAPFAPVPPAPETRPVAAEDVESAAAAAATQLGAHAVAVLDRLARVPVPRLAGGGVGVRELARLGKDLAMQDAEIRLVLELAAAGGLLEPGPEGLGVSEAFPPWRAAEPADQVAALLAVWWEFPGVPSESRRDGKTLPALRDREPCEGCRAARVALLQAAADLPAGRGGDLRGLAAVTRWARPLVHVLPQDAESPLASVWQEAELLGVVAAGALSPLGAALLSGDVAAAHDLLRRLLPGASDSAAFGSDLTAVVAGAPSARISSLLDGCADRESSGGAVTWRFSPASVRRALDAGIGGEELIGQLAAVAARDLPQPLSYLVGDVARRHGRLRLLSAASLIRSDDEALLAEVAADRRLSKLGLQRVAPTVLSSAAPLDATLARLREVGYFPVAERPAGAAVPEPPAVRPATTGPAQSRTLRDLAPQRDRAPRPGPEPLDPVQLAQGLLSAVGETPPEPDSAIAVEIAQYALRLSSWEVDQLVEAVETGGSVEIEYRSANGGTTRRLISAPELVDGKLYAWCELRQDERTFSVARILSVGPAD